MLPDFTTPAACPTCGSAKSHDVRNLDTCALLGRVFECGAAVSTNAVGGWFTAIVCRRAGEVIAALRLKVSRLTSDNVRLGDRNVLMAMELQAIADTAEASLGSWATAPLESFGYLYDLVALRTVYDLAVEALAPAVTIEPENNVELGQVTA